MQRSVILVLLTTVFVLSPVAQEATDVTILTEFTRTAEVSGLTVQFTYLNDRTVDVLFEPPGKYSLRAHARTKTMVFVRALPEKDTEFHTEFSMEQDGKTFEATIHNVKNFVDGTVPKGEQINGILQFDTRLDLTHPFTIKGDHIKVEFKLSSDALKLLEPQP